MYGKCSLNTDSQKSTWIAKFERWGPRGSKLGLAMRMREHADVRHMRMSSMPKG